ncbi:hypothetical protein CRV15_28790 (plasmid) [Streptomyces clavuligerus]|nr:hypothetical protein CRV15_28790 [Streptomyces clavuligerus]
MCRSDRRGGVPEGSRPRTDSGCRVSSARPVPVLNSPPHHLSANARGPAAARRSARVGCCPEDHGDGRTHPCRRCF